MASDGISRIDAVGPLAGMSYRAAVGAGQASGSVEPVGLPGAGAPAPVRLPVSGAKQGPVAGAPAPQERPKQAPGSDDTYVRIRYDKSAQTYVIQVRSAANDEVISEIPPEAWGRGGNLPLPKGMIVEKER